MSLDALTLIAGCSAFVVFLVVHIIAFRRVSAEQLLRSLVWCTLGVAWIPAFLLGSVYLTQALEVSLAVWLTSMILATLLLGLLCFVYVLCVFGPYETSIRMRLIREIAQAKETGISLEELLQRYNAAIITRTRLKRLVGSGDIIDKDGRYMLGRQDNFFFIFKAIAQFIKTCIAK